MELYRKYLVFVLFFILFIYSCNKKVGVRDGLIEVIDLSNMDFSASLNLSEIADSIEYVKLETSDECLISEGAIPFFCDSAIFILDRGGVLLFSRKGEFRRRFFNVGQGPGEGFARCCALNNKKQELLIYNNFKNTIDWYNCRGQLLSTHKYNNDEISFVNYISCFQDYVVLNNELLIPDFFSVYNNTLDSVIFSYQNQYKITINNPIVLFDSYCVNFQNVYDTVFYFKEKFCDTIFSTKDFVKFIPNYVFLWDINKKYSFHDNVKYKTLEDLDINKQMKYRIINFSLVNNFLFYRIENTINHEYVRHIGVYNKITKKNIILFSEKITNNIDEGVDFIPFNLRYSNHNFYKNYIYMMLNANELRDFVLNNPNLDHTKKMYYFSKDILDDDNPILILIKIKKC